MRSTQPKQALDFAEYIQAPPTALRTGERDACVRKLPGEGYGREARATGEVQHIQATCSQRMNRWLPIAVSRSIIRSPGCIRCHLVQFPQVKLAARMCARSPTTEGRL